ncbi:hypothetical protein LEP1GSC170_5519 [Leptospira interrogans serovar Bataviae str. HAI135]|nr:hypothetical protein LEP1GSC170_5519 [Leptospira interrogans serovar Bataviae str. HAI135]
MTKQEFVPTMPPNMKKISLFYIFLIFLFVLSLGFILQSGQNLELEKENFHSSQVLLSKKNLDIPNESSKINFSRPGLLDLEAIGKIFPDILNNQFLDFYFS